ncbi:GH1 family beta-glucosidase [Micromonospora sp. 067-2]|uniref:GH1 family beta-glucosidase n=1 Tax=Micromonospora sp. 067-2 TaxID=2789270 RepID=UPI00397874A7
MTTASAPAPLTLPAGFRWGTATSAYQVEGAVSEGGRGRSVWDTFSHTPGLTHQGDTGDVACDHYHRLDEDLDLLADLGVDTYRFSIAWPRLQPTGRGRPEPRGVAFYDRLIDGLLERQISPMATLFHWDLPQDLEDRGGWRNRDTVHDFVTYARYCFDAYGDRVTDWITLNEPICPSLHGTGGYGHAAPGLRLGGPAITSAHHLLLAHGDAVRAYRNSAAAGRIGITLNFGPVAPASDRAEDLAAAARVDALQTRLFADPVLGRGYPDLLVRHWRELTDMGFVQAGDLERIAEPLDFLGVNYYKSWVARAAGLPPLADRVAMDMGAVLEPPPGVPRTGFGWGVTPDGLRTLLLDLRHRHPALPPLFVTENGCAYPDEVGPDGNVDDPERIAFHDAYLRALAEAVDAGVDVRGYTCWSLLDNFEWAAGYSQRFGLVHVDFPTGRRTPKSSFGWYRDLISTHRAAGVAA